MVGGDDCGFGPGCVTVYGSPWTPSDPGYFFPASPGGSPAAPGAPAPGAPNYGQYFNLPSQGRDYSTSSTRTNPRSLTPSAAVLAPGLLAVVPQATEPELVYGGEILSGLLDQTFVPFGSAAEQPGSILTDLLAKDVGSGADLARLLNQEFTPGGITRTAAAESSAYGVVSRLIGGMAMAFAPISTATREFDESQLNLFDDFGRELPGDAPTISSFIPAPIIPAAFPLQALFYPYAFDYQGQSYGNEATPTDVPGLPNAPEFIASPADIPFEQPFPVVTVSAPSTTRATAPVFAPPSGPPLVFEPGSAAVVIPFPGVEPVTIPRTQPVTRPAPPTTEPLGQPIGFPANFNFAAPFSSPLFSQSPAPRTRPKTAPQLQQSTDTNKRTCQCNKKGDQKKQPKKPRDVCYRGTYIEHAKGLTKHRKEKIQCQ